MSTQSLEIRRSSASVWGSLSGMRTAPVVSKYIDTTTCIGCKACEVACQEWNDLKPVATQQVGTYQTLPTLHPEYWNLIRFNERDFDGGIVWLMRASALTTRCQGRAADSSSVSARITKATCRATTFMCVAIEP